MTTIRISPKTKEALENFMEEQLKLMFAESKDKEQLFIQMIKKRYGMSHDQAIMLLLSQCRQRIS